MKDMQVFKVFDDVDTRLFSDCVSIMKERYEDAVNNRLSAESRGELIKNILATHKFSGHGYEGADFFTEAFSIYHRADVYSFVLNYPSFCPEFTEFWISAVKGLLKYPLEPDDWSVSSELAEKSKLLRCEVLAKHSDFAKKATGLLRKTV